MKNKLLTLSVMSLLLCGCSTKDPLPSVLNTVKENEYDGICELTVDIPSSQSNGSISDKQTISCNRISDEFASVSVSPEIVELSRKLIQQLHSKVGEATYTAEDTQNLDLNDIYLMFQYQQDDTDYKLYFYDTGHLALYINKDIYYYSTEDNFYSSIIQSHQDYLKELKQVSQSK